MNAISLQQPYASLVVLGMKKLETRSRYTKFRGNILIHASKKEWKPAKGEEKLIEHMTRLDFWDKVKHIPYGAIIGSVDISDCCDTLTWNAFPISLTHELTEQERAFGDYSPNRWVYSLENPILFKEPIPAKGSVTIPWQFDYLPI